jgi:superfamily II DNA/RNA helicase
MKANPISYIGKHIPPATQQEVQRVVKQGILDRLAKEEHSRDNLLGIKSALRATKTSIDKGVIHPEIIEKIEERLFTNTDLHQSSRFDYTDFLKHLHSKGIYKNFKPETLDIITGKKSNLLGAKTLVPIPAVSPEIIMQTAMLKDTQKIKDINFVEVWELDKVLADIQELNKNNPEIIELTKKGGELDACYRNTRTKAKKDSIVFHQGEYIHQWTKENIAAWSAQMLKNPAVANDSKMLPEILAVTERALLLYNKNTPRSVQLASVIMMELSGDKGKLLQISTGEGKSCTTAMLAVLNGLKSKNVDVITSSSVLAKRDAEEWSSFYDIFGLTNGHNITTGHVAGLKECYTKNIVYGDALHYQADTLRDEYKLLGTKGGRNFANSVALIDEVDSMLIDDSGRIAKLATPAPSMEYLAPIFVTSFNYLKQLVNYFKEEEINGGAPLDTQMPWIEKNLTNYIEKLVGISDIIDDTEQILVPKHLQSFVEKQAPIWAKSAIQALSMSEKRDYLIIGQDGKKVIAPIDYASTGVVQERTSWTNGLHQYMQIKHNLAMSSENLTSSFISNIAYFKRYNRQIFGMSGTLGSTHEQELLKRVYDIDLAFIPTFKPKQFTELPAIVADSNKEWHKALLDTAKTMGQEKRATLILAETIEDVENIQQSLIDGGIDKDFIHKYTTGSAEENQKVIEDKARVGHIIVATNLAGRGTDIKVTQMVENAGGLHVCVSFLPTNLRVEEQAFGRTARQGLRGSAQLVINGTYEALKLHKAVSEQENLEDLSDIDSLKLRRDAAELLRLDDIQTRLIPKITIEDELFARFSALSHELKDRENNENKQRQLEEHWGLWFKDASHKLEAEARDKDGINREEILQSLEHFSTDMKARYGSNAIMQNPAYLTLEAVNKFGEGNSYDRSIELLNHVSSTAEEYGFAANYNLAYCYFRQNSVDLKKNDMNLVNKGIEHLNQSLMQLETVAIPQLHMMQIMVGSEENNSELATQIATKLNLHKMQSNYIRNALKKIEQGVSQGKVVVVKSSETKPIFEIVGQQPNKASEEVLELSRFGSTQFFTLDAKKPPRDILSAIGVGILGVSQFIVGALVTVCSAGAATAFGVSMMMSGAQDLYKGVRVGMGKESMDWGNYWINKGISYAISIISMGWDNFKAGLSAVKEQAGRLVDAGKNFFTSNATNVMGRQAASQIAKEGIKEGVKDTATQTTFTSIAQDFITKKGMSTMVMEVGKSIVAQNVTSVIAKQIANSLEGTKEDVRQDAYNKIMHTLNSEPTSTHLNRLIAMDKMVGSDSQVKAIRIASANALSPKIDRITQLARQLSTAAMTGMAARSGNTAANIGMKVAVTGIGIAEATSEIKQLIGNFCDDLQGKIAEIDQKATALMPKVMSAYMRKFISQKEHIDSIIAILQQNKVLNTDTMQFNNDLMKPLVNFEAGIAFKEPLPQPVIKEPEIHNGIVINKPVPGAIQAFQLEDLRIKSEQHNGKNIEEIDFGPFRSYRDNIIQVARHLNDSQVKDHQKEKQELAEELAGKVSNRTMGIIRHSIITPVVSPVVNIGVDQMAQQFMSIATRPVLGLGIAAGDEPIGRMRIHEAENAILVTDDIDYRDMPELTEVEDDTSFSNSNTIEVPPKPNTLSNFELNKDSEISEMLKAIRENEQSSNQVPIFDSSNKSITVPKESGFSFINSAQAANPIGGIATTMGGGIVGQDLALAAAFKAGSSITSGAMNIARVIPTAAIATTAVVAINETVKFQQQHPLMDEDFLDIITNPLNSEQNLNARWEQVRNDPLLGIANTGINMPVTDTELSRLLENIRMDIDPNANKPTILSTPIVYQPKSIPFTPDDSSTLAKFGQLEGFMPSDLLNTGLKESYPDQSELIAKMGMDILERKIDLDYGKLSKEHFDNDVRYIHGKKYEGAKIQDLDQSVIKRMDKLIITDKYGHIKGVHNTQDHHIVHQATKGAKELFEKLGLDIHAAENRITLPSDIKLTETEITKMTQHVGKHDDRVLEEITEKIQDIKTSLQEGAVTKDQAKEKLLDFIQKQRHELENGKQFLNSVGRK